MRCCVMVCWVSGGVMCSSCWFMNLRIYSSGPQNGISEILFIMAILLVVVLFLFTIKIWQEKDVASIFGMNFV